MKQMIFALLSLLTTMGAVSPATVVVNATTLGPIVDPIPNPGRAGWLKEGSETFSAWTPLVINDANAVPNPAFPQPYCNFYVTATDAVFASEIRINPTVAVDANFVNDGFGSTGVHVTINDGFQEIKAALIVNAGGGLKVAIRTQAGFSPGLNLPGLGGTFVLKRTVAGDAVLEVGGLTETLNAAGLPGSNRPGVKTIEFGTYDALASSVSRWTTLGLPKVPISGTAPSLVPVTINNSPGDQSDPHVSGDWVAYTSDLSIRYYNFATNTDAEIPRGPSVRDLLSDISGSKIVFSRTISGVKTAVMVFDAATPGVPPVEIDAAAGTTRLGSAIGGNTVAYVDFGLQANGELVIHDLTTATSLRITNDTAPDQSPSVSSNGEVVTWEHCNASLSNCDIWQAVKSGAVWTVGIVSDSPNAEANPDTNGTIVVYDSYRAGNSDIFWRSVAGGQEVQLQMPSFEGNPSIAGNFISFESRPTPGATADIFVYDIFSNLLYQITNTPGVTEQLNDITLLPNGNLRVVWASDEDGPSSRNIKSATFHLGSQASTLAVQVPATITVNATSPSGAIATYVVTATDAVDPNPTVACLPVSGSSFPIGTTVVTCTATNAFGEHASGSFSVVVLGAPDQISALIALVQSFHLRPVIAFTLEGELWIARALATSSEPLRACGWLNLFIREVQVQKGRTITPVQAAQLMAQANQIKAVLGCR